MEFWIYFILAIIGLCFIGLVVYFIRCVCYRRVFKKIRTMSMASHAQEAEVPHTVTEHSATVGIAPPPYSICHSHRLIFPAVPIITIETEAERLREQGTTQEQYTTVISDIAPPSYTSCMIDVQNSGSALPFDDFIISPPYCLEPPTYYDVTIGMPQIDIADEGCSTFM